MFQPANQIETKTCNTCTREMPITEFRRRRRGSEKRHNQCRQCYAAYMRQLRRAHRHRDIAKFVQRVKSPHRSPSVITALCTVIIRRFGGLDSFCLAWKEAFDIAKASRSACKLVLDSFLAVARLMEISSQQCKDRSHFDDVSTEELERAVEDYIKRVLKEEFGWENA